MRESPVSDELQDIWVKLHEPNVSVASVIAYSHTARRAIRATPPPAPLPRWIDHARSIEPRIEFVLPHPAMRLAFHDQTGRRVRGRNLFVSSYATPTTSGIVASFEFRSSIEQSRALSNADTREWLHHNAASVQNSLTGYWLANEEAIHAHWIDGVVRSLLPVLDRLASIDLDARQALSTLSLIRQDRSTQMHTRDILGIASVKPVRS